VAAIKEQAAIAADQFTDVEDVATILEDYIHTEDMNQISGTLEGQVQ
jgi:hypothetical protein